MIFWVSFINFSFKVAGINTVMYYAAKIISMAGYSDNTQVNNYILSLPSLFCNARIFLQMVRFDNKGMCCIYVSKSNNLFTGGLPLKVKKTICISFTLLIPITILQNN